MSQQLKPGLTAEDVGKAIKIRDLKFDTAAIGTMQKFKTGSYNSATGEVIYTVKSLAPFAEKLTRLHKASTKDPLFYLNIFFGSALLFFVLSSFWMFMPKTSIFKKGLYFTIAGVALVVLMLLL